MKSIIAAIAVLVVVVLATPVTAQSQSGKPELTPFQKKVAEAMKSPERSARNRLRDRNRDPVSALHFCRMRDDMKVLEWAPGFGWYTEILGPVLKDRGLLVVSTLEWALKRVDKMLIRPSLSKVVRHAVDVTRHPVSHDITVNNLDFGRTDFDLALNIREYHNLAAPTVLKFDKAVLKSLKPGGHYCVIDHTRRHMDPDIHENRRRIDPVKVIKQVQEAGFELVDYTDLFFRPDDELRYEVGRKTVRGNTDRFTLLFRKPAR